MASKSTVVALMCGVLCGSCAQNDGGASANAKSGKTLAGAADTSKKKSGEEGEVRIPQAPVVAAPAESGNAAAPGDSNTAAPSADLSDMPLAPTDAKWTIYCATLADPGHVETARALKAGLIKSTGMREWYILHENAQSRVYYGFYRSINDPTDAAETARAQKDRKKIDALVDGNNQRPFRACQFVQLSAPDPESPPEWNVMSVPADRKWSLMIAGYKDHPDRKKFAVDAVREARARGIEAYYFHGDNVSNVFIGAWPEEAVEEVRHDPDPAARKSGRGDVLVLPPGIKPEAGVRDKKGRPISAVSQQLVAVDEELKKTAAEYSEFSMNGETIVYKGKGKTWTESSKVVRIPRPSENLFRENVAADARDAGGGLEAQDPFGRPGYQDSAGTTDNQRPSNPSRGAGAGGLRSIDGDR